MCLLGLGYHVKMDICRPCSKSRLRRTDRESIDRGILRYHAKTGICRPSNRPHLRRIGRQFPNVDCQFVSCQFVGCQSLNVGRLALGGQSLLRMLGCYVKIGSRHPSSKRPSRRIGRGSLNRESWGVSCLINDSEREWWKSYLR